MPSQILHETSKVGLRFGHYHTHIEKQKQGTRTEVSIVQDALNIKFFHSPLFSKRSVVLADFLLS